MGVRPESVEIFSKQYQIEYCERPSDVDKEGRESLWGQIDHWTHSIRIYAPDGFSNAEIWDSLIHEILHVLAEEFKLDLKEHEEQVSLLALGLADVLIRNGWLREGLT
jgi:hypothetical protein